MDSLLEKLDPLSSKRRTTYKKVFEPQEEEETQQISNSPPPPILGNGFLFQNSTIDKVRSRLRNAEDGANEVQQKEQEQEQEQETQLNQTQVIADLYEGAEELEEQNKERVRLPLSKKTSSASQEKTQVIPWAPTVEGVENNVEQGTDIHEEKTQQVPNEISYDQKTQAIQSFQQTEVEPLTQRISEPERTLDVPTYAATSEDQLDTQEQNPITQLDISNSLLFQATDSGIPKSPPQRLKMHDIEKELEEKRQERDHRRNIEYRAPEKPVNVKRVFSKEAFLKNFDEESSSEDELIELRSRDLEKKHTEKDKSTLENTTESSQRQRVFSVYEYKLKGELDSKRCIQLDDDEDESDEDVEVPLSRVSKATVLDIKARRSKQEPLSKIKQKKTTLNDLICTLKKASKKQITDHQNELMKSRGYKLEDIEKQKEEIENLLEQEIARNKRLARRENEEDNSNDLEDRSYGSGNESENSAFSDIEFSGDSESDDGQEDDMNNDDERVQKEKTQEAGDSDNISAQEDHSDEEDEDSIQKGRTKNHKMLPAEDSDSEHDDTLPRNIIDLGPYGNNLQVNHEEDMENLPPSDSAEIDAAEEEKTNELIMEKIRKIEMRKKKKEQRLKDMKAKGLNKMLEMEAEESEDEWKGVGGVDGDLSDEHDSDLEEMIDDFTKSNENFDDVRQLLAKENKELDEKMVNKILYDIKNGGFRKRGRNALDLELSDDEDEDLRNYRLKRRELMKKSRIEGKDKEKAFRNAKSKAFLESMVDDIDESKNPFGDPEMDVEDNTDVDTQENDYPKNKEKNTLSQEFVQRSLSFLSNNNSSREFELGEQITLGDEEQDVSSLKRNSSIHALHNSSSPIKEDLEKENQDEDFITLPNFKPPSLIKSLAGGFDPNNKFQSGKKTVTVSKSYRAVGGSRSSITYFGKMRKLVGPKNRNSTLYKGPRPASKPTMGKLWESQQNSFDT
ncbi:hypothetical protein ZYGR_0Y00190 [Zygosaccharomyces rouxii]|uniref:DNA replication checkpoint mediator MRC1 domain-containing protein n=1 Tax=Zygosaccharomyces rouxii TaxID=4956 RepID=A0A1Q3A4H4_ZYGRO|nr:hypothetical protein ZYGR_0Y00190 [Zygosaccharomyces rouxii]